MSKINHTPIEKPKPKAIWGVLAAVLFALPLPAQYVATLVSSNLSQPWGVVAATNGNVYLTDSAHNRVVQYPVTGGTITALAASGLSEPLGIAAAGGGLAVVDQNNQVIRFVSYSGAVSTLAGTEGSVGSNDSPGATFSYPVGITADGAGNFYVADWGNSAIRKIDVNTNVTTVPTGGYQFNGPKAVAVDNNGNLWVADTGNEVICLISNGVATVIAGTPGQSGAGDSPPAASAQFNAPSGVLWDSVNNRLLISDSGNATIRSLFLTNYNGSNIYAVATIAGAAGQIGLVNGLPGAAEFGYPVGLAVDAVDSGFYIVDFGENALRVLQPSAPQPPIATPVIGYVTYPATANPPYTSVFVPSSGGTYNNLLSVVVQQDGGALSGMTTYYTFGSPSSLGTNSQAVNPYPGDGSSSAVVGPSIINFPNSSDVTIYAISEEAGRQPSGVTNAHFQFVTANPQIVGNNGADIQLLDSTVGALIYYTVDGSTPTNDGTSGTGVTTGATLPAINITSNVTFQAKAFASGFAPSAVVSETLSVSNFVGNQMTFGFATGVASSRFIAAAGQTFYAPITLSLLPSSPSIYSMQFDLYLTNGSGIDFPSFASANPKFQSFLMTNIPNTTPPIYAPINPGIEVTGGTVNTGILINSSENLFEIGWLTTYGQTNLYNTLNQSLTEISLAADTFFPNPAQPNGVVVGGLSFTIPTNAANGSTCIIQISRPSASSFSGSVVPLPVFLQAPTNGSMTNGAINSIKTVTVGSFPYLAGDVYPLNWYNAGDFGDFNLLNDDVIQTFVSAIDLLNIPPADSDYFNAMDSSDANNNNLYNGNDTSINSISMGDGIIDVGDVYVTFRRSLDPSLTNYIRYWTNGTLVAVPTNNVVVLSDKSPAAAAAPVKTALTGPRYITVAADQVQSGGNLSLQLPIRVLAADSLPIRVFMFNVEVDPLDGSPPVTSAVSFTPGAGLGASTLTASQSVNFYAGAWLDSTVAGISGTNVIGTLSVTLPPNVTSNSAYRVHFDHFSASPNGIATFHTTVNDGLITVGNRTGSSWGDGIPDTWRLLYFGTVSNALSAANADPDGDGASNWQEYVAGTNPLDAASVLKLQAATAVSGGYFTLQWPSVVNKSYSLQRSASISAGGWTTVATNLPGTGQMMQWPDSSAASGARFYRVLVQ